MKIDLSSGKKEISSLKDRQHINTPPTGKTESPMATGKLQLRNHELLMRSIESLLRHLKPANKGHESLRGLINLISQLPQITQPPPGQLEFPGDTKDYRLLLQVFKLMREKHERTLPEKVAEELKLTEKILEKNLRKDLEAPFVFPEKEEMGRPELRIREESKDSAGKETEYQLKMQIDFEILGPISVILRRKGMTQICQIQTSGKKSRNIIRKAHNVLVKQIKERDLHLDNIKTHFRANIRQEEPDFQFQGQSKDLDLWV